MARGYSGREPNSTQEMRLKQRFGIVAEKTRTLNAGDCAQAAAVIHNAAMVIERLTLGGSARDSTLPRRVEKDIALGGSTPCYRQSAIIDSVRTNTVEEPVRALRAIDQGH